MTPTERENVAVTLCRLWPGKFRDEELVDLCDRLDRYRARDVVSALNDHKNSSKWRPQASEILARMKGKEVRDSSTPLVRHDSLAEAVRKQRPELGGVPDAEVVMRHWRSEWFRYRGASDARRAVMVRAFDRNAIPRPTRATLLRQHNRNAASVRRKCVVGCAGCLVSAGLESVLATRYAMAAMKAEPGTFRSILNDLRDFAPAAPEAA